MVYVVNCKTVCYMYFTTIKKTHTQKNPHNNNLKLLFPLETFSPYNENDTVE